MRSRVNRAGLLTLSLTLALMAQAAQALDPSGLPRGPVEAPIRQLPPQGVPVPLRQPPVQQLPTSAIIRGEQLTKQQFDALPDGAVIDFRGTRITAGEARAQIRQAEIAARAQAQTAGAQAQAKFEAYRAKVLQEQKAKLDAANAKVRAEMARLRQASVAAPVTQHQAIQKEAVELLNRANTATPAEQGQIEQRALQLHRQIQQLQPPPR